MPLRNLDEARRELATADTALIEAEANLLESVRGGTERELEALRAMFRRSRRLPVPNKQH
jgi:outer membrane protein TolC